jgi:hypothetical protein
MGSKRTLRRREQRHAIRERRRLMAAGLPVPSCLDEINATTVRYMADTVRDSLTTGPFVEYLRKKEL